MVGSMPQKTASDALAMLAKYPLSIPTWPQLPKRDYREGMSVQYCEGLPGIRYEDVRKTVWVERNDDLFVQMGNAYESIMSGALESFAITASHAAGLDAFLTSAGTIGAAPAWVKGQIIGPFTLGLGLNDADCRAVWFDEQYRDVMLKVLGAKASWMARQLGRGGSKVIISLDEPIFSALGTPAYMGIDDEAVVATLDEIAAAVHETGGLVSVHCCGNMDWSLLAKSTIDIISFDAFGFGDKVALYPADIRAFLERGGYLACGIVPTLDDATAASSSARDLHARLETLFKLFVSKGIPDSLIRQSALLTPSCGMGNLAVQSAEHVLRTLAHLRDACLT